MLLEQGVGSEQRLTRRGEQCYGVSPALGTRDTW